MVIIRAALISDTGFISMCTDAAYAGYIDVLGRKPEPMTITYEATMHEYDAWIAEKDAQPLGVLLMQYGPQDALIFSVAVMPTRQGEGIGTALLDHAEACSREKGYQSIRLYTNERMRNNVSLYLSRGYKETGRESRKDGAVVHMAKPI